MKRILFVLCLLLVLVGVTNAQEEAVCTPENLQEALSDIAGVILEQAQSVTESNADNIGLSLAIALEVAAMNLRGACYSTELRGDDYPSGIIGPISFGGEIYETTFTGGQFATVSFTQIEGSCGINFMSLPIEGGEESDIMRFTECTALIEVNNPDENWTLTFNRIR